MLRIIMSALLLAGLVLPAHQARAQSQGTSYLSEVEQRIFASTNVFRKQESYPPLKENERLRRDARSFAKYLAATDKFSHTADGREPWDRAREQNYDYCIILENIAYQFDSRPPASSALADRFMQSWRDSPGHRQNLLNKHVTEIGVGVAKGEATDKYFAVQLFGRPRSAEIQFEIVNHTSDIVYYNIDGQRMSVPPHVTMFHQDCRQPELQLPWDSKDVFQPASGSRYVIRKDEADKLRVEKQ